MTDPLAAWKAALPYASTTLLSCIVEGDSTFAGQAATGDPYSPVTRIRQQLAAAGVTDGGHGVMNGVLDTSTVSGEPSDASVTEPAYNINDGQNLQANYVGSTNNTGAAYVAHLYGTRIRVSFARYGSASVVDVSVDGTTERITVPVRGTLGGSADANWQAGTHYVKTGLSYGLHTVTVTLVSGRLSCLVQGTRDAGVVLNNYAARAAQAVATPWHQFQDWAGLNVTNTPPAVPSTLATGPTAQAAILGIYAKGGNDQQGNGGTDTSALYRAKAYDFARAIIAAGGSAIICSPWWESFNQPQLASQYRAASVAAASDAGALWLDLGPGGALAGHTGEAIGGANNNPHLTALAYQYQGDYIANALLAGYTGPSTPGQPGTGTIAGRTVLGYRLAGLDRALIGFRRPNV